MSKHLDPSELIAYLDGETSRVGRESVRLHLEDCSRCRASFQEIYSRRARVQTALSVLEQPGLAQMKPISTAAARKRLASRLFQPQKENQTMLNRLFSRRLRPAWITLLVVLVLGLSLAVPQVRAFATDLLGIFRVEQITVVPINPSNLPEDLQDLEPSIDRLLSDNVDYQVLGDPQKAADAAEASALAGFNVRLPGGEKSPQGIIVQPGIAGSFALDVGRINEILREMDRVELLLPASLDGQEVTVEIPSSVMAGFGNCTEEEISEDAPMGKAAHFSAFHGSDCRVLIQLPSPALNAPSELNVTEIGKTFLMMSGMSEAEADNFSRKIDWTSTLVVPIPMDSSTYQDVRVDGAAGTLIQETSERRGSDYILMWVKDGSVYAVTGSGDSAQALELANSLP